MPFQIPNEASAAFADQAEPDAVDIDILVAALKGDYVVSGCAVTAQGSPDMTVAVAVGVVRINGVSVAVSAGNVTVGAAHATNPRFYLITVNDSGTKACTAGTAAANPVFPAIPANSVVLAAVYVPANDTDIDANQIVDKRVIGGLPGGSNTQVQFNDSGVFGGDADLTWDKTNNVLLLAANGKVKAAGQLYLESGGDGDWIQMTGANALTSGFAGGGFSLRAGNGAGTGPGGDIDIEGGYGGASGSGGNVVVIPGKSNEGFGGGTDGRFRINKASDFGNWAEFDTDALTTPRAFAFPDAAGTLALLNGAQVFASSVSAISFRSPEVAFASLPGSPSVGELANVSDGSTATWGATLAGGGANKVLARWNGANWTVVGK